MANNVIQTVAIFNSCMSSSEFKEKFARALQYGARMLGGILTDVDKVSPNGDRADLIKKVTCFVPN